MKKKIDQPTAGQTQVLAKAAGLEPATEMQPITRWAGAGITYTLSPVINDFKSCLHSAEGLEGLAVGGILE